MTTTLTSKGQATIPKPIRDRLGLKAGSRLKFVVNDRGELVLRPEDESEQIARRKRLEAAIDAIQVDHPWHGGTDKYMTFLRGDE
jgi:antitoxin PrlF